MEACSDSDSNTSFSELHSRGITADIDNENMAHQEREHDRIRAGQRFLEMNNQNRGLTTLD